MRPSRPKDHGILQAPSQTSKSFIHSSQSSPSQRWSIYSKSKFCLSISGLKSKLEILAFLQLFRNPSFTHVRESKYKILIFLLLFDFSLSPWLLIFFLPSLTSYQTYEVSPNESNILLLSTLLNRLNRSLLGQHFTRRDDLVLGVILSL